MNINIKDNKTKKIPDTYADLCFPQFSCESV